MGAAAIASLSLGLAATLVEAFQRYRAANAALEVMLKENRGPTEAEKAVLRAAGAIVDARLEELLAPDPAA